ncbi:hypothetical protein EYF80_044282 [Liparis tanakae]|uniref:Uncharacterized protein n=1 Tax=Liparis tanakae TaxID=230148 RepID=A0A4Z2FX83_9TELE|nr:hypothetical protein EYF80_044282 [Liparis tanakae]
MRWRDQVDTPGRLISFILFSCAAAYPACTAEAMAGSRATEEASRKRPDQ